MQILNNDNFVGESSFECISTILFKNNYLFDGFGAAAEWLQSLD